MIIVEKTLGDLRGSVIYLRTNCSAKEYPTEFQTYQEAWESLFQSLDHLNGKLGIERYEQLVDMAKQAKSHYDSEQQDKHQGFLGSWLMQDIEQLVKGKATFAYPKDLYRWPI